MRRFGFAIGCVVAVLVVIEAGIALADTVTLNETDDTWVRQEVPNTCYHGDNAISVWAKNSPGEGYWRNGDLQFDLSSVSQQIIGANLELYATNTGNNDGAFNQVCHLVSPSPSKATFDAWTYNGYTGGIGSSYTVTQFDTFGSYTLAASQPRQTWYDSNSADAPDLLALENTRTGTNKVLTLSLDTNTSSDGIHDWGNTKGGFSARLILTTTAPEPSSIVLLGLGLLSLLAYGWRKRK